MIAYAYSWLPRTEVWKLEEKLDLDRETAEGTIDEIAQVFVEKGLKTGDHSFLVAVGDIVREYLREERPRAVRAIR